MIPPGGEGKITLSINTKGYEGDHRWDAKVNTNDPLNDLFYLVVTAQVEVPIYVSPRYVLLNAAEGTGTSKAVEIRAGLDRPLELKAGRFSLEGKATYEIEELKKGKLFRIVFTHLPAPAGTYQGILQVETNYPEEPLISISVRGRSIGARQGKPTGSPVPHPRSGT